MLMNPNILEECLLELRNLINSCILNVHSYSGLAMTPANHLMARILLTMLEPWNCVCTGIQPFVSV